MYILYGGDFTRSVLVQWVLEEGGLAYEFRKVDILKGEHKTSAFLSINPSGLVPVLVTPEGQALCETAALMLHLADRHHLAGLAPAPEDPQRGLFLSTIFYIASDIQPEMKRFHFPHRFSPRRDDDATIHEMAKLLILERLLVTSDRLARHGPYLLGTRFSLADAYLSFWVAWLDLVEVRARAPLVAGLYDLVKTRPRIGTYLDETERMAVSYGLMMDKTPGGIIP